MPRPVLALAALMLFPVAAFSAVTFSCKAERVNSFPQPSTVTVRFDNGGDEPVAVRFDITLTASNGAVAPYLAQGKDRTNASSWGEVSISPFSDQQTVYGETVLPTSCALSNIEVCPTLPPSTWNPTAYYNSFRDGGSRCSRGGNFGPVQFSLAPAKAAVLNVPAELTFPGCVGNACLVITSVRRGTRCGNQPDSIEVDISNNSAHYLNGYIVFTNPAGKKVFSPTGVMKAGATQKGGQWICHGTGNPYALAATGNDDKTKPPLQQ